MEPDSIANNHDNEGDTNDPFFAHAIHDRGLELTISKSEYGLRKQIDDDKNNSYATTKSISQMQLDFENIQKNIGLLIALFATSLSATLTGFEVALITLIVCAGVIHLLIFILATVLANSTTEKVSRKCQCNATQLNSTVTTLSGISLILNMVITAVSIQTQMTRHTQITDMLSRQ